MHYEKKIIASFKFCCLLLGNDITLLWHTAFSAISIKLSFSQLPVYFEITLCCLAENRINVQNVVFWRWESFGLKLLKFHNKSQISAMFLGADVIAKTMNKRNDSSTGEDTYLMSEDSAPGWRVLRWWTALADVFLF